MRKLTALGVAAIIAVGPGAASAATSPQLPTTGAVIAGPSAAGGEADPGVARTTGFFTSINCYFFNRC